MLLFCTSILGIAFKPCQSLASALKVTMPNARRIDLNPIRSAVRSAIQTLRATLSR